MPSVRLRASSYRTKHGTHTRRVARSHAREEEMHVQGWLSLRKVRCGSANAWRGRRTTEQAPNFSRTVARLSCSHHSLWRGCWPATQHPHHSCALVRMARRRKLKPTGVELTPGRNVPGPGNQAIMHQSSRARFVSIAHARVAVMRVY
jgi:hypothetical protein